MIITVNDRTDAGGGVDYFHRHFGNNPALEAGFSKPTWFQRPDNLLELPEKPTLAAFENLLYNRHPLTGDRLTARTKTTRLRACHELSGK